MISCAKMFDGWEQTELLLKYSKVEAPDFSSVEEYLFHNTIHVQRHETWLIWPLHISLVQGPVYFIILSS